MTIITRKRTDNFALIPNSVAEDENLSFAARGLLCYLLVKPDNWKVNIDDIRRTGGIGRDKAYALIKELRDKGYITLDVRRDETGKIRKQDYVVYDCALVKQMPLNVPQNKPLPENTEQAEPFPEKPEVVQPFPDLPDPAEPDTAKPDGIIINKDNNTHSPLTPKRLSKAERYKKNLTLFETFWNEWPDNHRPDYRDSAMKLFMRLKAHEQEGAISHAATYRKHMGFRNQKIRMLPYLKDRLFNEYEGAPAFDWDGYFKITPERREWPVWLRYMKTVIGDKAESNVKAQGFLLTKHRWPETATEADKVPEPKQEVLAL